MSVRTTRLAVGRSLGAGVSKVVYTCPQGHTAIVKDMRWSSAASTDGNVIWFVTSGPSAVNIVSETLLANGKTAALMPYIVLEPDDTLQLITAVAQGASYWVSGVELVGVAP